MQLWWDLPHMQANADADLACRRQVSRDKATNIGRAMSNVSSAVIFGGIFWRMGCSQSSIQDRMGLLQACTTLPLPQTMHTSMLTRATKPWRAVTCTTSSIAAVALMVE